MTPPITPLSVEHETFGQLSCTLLDTECLTALTISYQGEAGGATGSNDSEQPVAAEANVDTEGVIVDAARGKVVTVGHCVGGVEEGRW